MNVQLKGLTALVGGSTQGIGRAIASELAAAGANCWLLARDEQALKEATESMPVVEPGQLHRYSVADFTDITQMQKAAADIAAAGPVHVLINNTGGPKPGPIVQATSEQFLMAFQQHLICNQLLAQALLPGMKQAGYGRIINIISTSIRIPIDNLGVSNTTRGAVASWAKTLSNEVARYGITVNNLLPGLTETQRLQSLIQSEAARQGKSENDVAQALRGSIPAQRFGPASELAWLAVFLASPLAGYVNGVSIPVDGGRTGTI